VSQITHFVQSSLKKNDDFFKTTIIKRYRAGTKINGVCLLLFLKLNINVNNRVIYSSIQSSVHAKHFVKRSSTEATATAIANLRSSEATPSVTV
jgi:hypothetical protein